MKKKTLMKNYNAIAKEFKGYRRVWPLVKEFLKDKKGTVLDIGCGNAGYLKGVLNQERKFIGVDFSMETLKLAKPIVKNCVCADAANLPIKNNRFGKIICVALVHHLPDEIERLKVFAEIKRVLKNGGEAIISSWKKKEGKADVIKPWGKYERFYHLFSDGELERLAREAGLRVTASLDDGKNYFITCQKPATNKL